MKIKGKYMLREVAGEIVAISVGETVLNSNVLIVLNESGKFFWEQLTKDLSEQEIINAVCEEYEVDEETVRKDLTNFVNYLRENKVEIE